MPHKRYLWNTDLMILNIFYKYIIHQAVGLRLANSDFKVDLIRDIKSNLIIQYLPKLILN